MCFFLCYALVALLAGGGLASEGAELPPNIVLVLADDIGWADYGFRTPGFPTPVLDWLAASGVQLGSYYTQPLCTPSRSALMTGRYPMRMGMAHGVLLGRHNRSLPLQERTLAQILKRQGYRTHLVGKWHLGFHMWEATPTFRGFDTFYGFYNGLGDYYRHTCFGGYDFRKQTRVEHKAAGLYSTTLFEERAREIIAQHDRRHPLFLLLSHQAPHSPLQVPRRFRQRTAGIFPSEPKRDEYAAMVAALDDSIGAVVDALKSREMWSRTVLVFSSDNGGPIPGDSVNMNIGASNWPLRGGKHSLTEGGVRGTAVIYSPPSGALLRPGP
eukprot:RCo041365